MYMYSIHTACILVMFADTSRARVQVGRHAPAMARSSRSDTSRARVQVGRAQTRPTNSLRCGHIPRESASWEFQWDRISQSNRDTSRARVQVGSKCVCHYCMPQGMTHPARECKLGVRHLRRNVHLVFDTSRARVQVGSTGRPEIPRSRIDASRARVQVGRINAYDV